MITGEHSVRSYCFPNSELRETSELVTILLKPPGETQQIGAWLNDPVRGTADFKFHPDGPSRRQRLHAQTQIQQQSKS